MIHRLGRFHRKLGPGFHWKWPGFEKYLGTNVVVTTLNLGSQSLTTADGKGVVVSAIVKYHIADVERFLLHINDAVDAITDVTMAEIRTIITATDWASINNGTDDRIERGVREVVKKWGIAIEPGGVVLTDVQVCRSLRLLFSEE